jgi:hypothetical protein
MKMHHYHPETREYLSTSDAPPDQLQPGKFIVAINTTSIEPPHKDGHIPVWTEKGWELQEDHRGKTLYSTQDGSAVTVDAIGPLAQVAPQATDKAPPELPAGKKLRWTGKKWALDDLPPLPPPQVVTMRQARLALLQAGRLEAVNAAILEMPGIDGEAARVEWEYAQEIRRDNPLIAAVAKQMGMDEAALDALFKVAAEL